MTNEKFVSAIKSYVCDDAVQSAIQGIVEVGRGPSESLLRLSSWYKELPTRDKTFVQEAMRRGIELSMFKFLYILDDPNAIVPAGEKGVFELTFTGSSGVTVLNDKRDPLHDIFRSLAGD